MADTSNERSGSRWEPDSSEHVTEDLTPSQETEVVPGLREEPAVEPVKPRKRLPKAAAAVAIVAAATLGGGAIGLALAGNRSQPVSDTATTSESGGAANQDQGAGGAPDGSEGIAPGFGAPDGDGYGPGGDRDGDGYGFDGDDHGFGHHGPGGH